MTLQDANLDKFVLEKCLENMQGLLDLIQDCKNNRSCNLLNSSEANRIISDATFILHSSYIREANDVVLSNKI